MILSHAINTNTVHKHDSAIHLIDKNILAKTNCNFKIQKKNMNRKCTVCGDNATRFNYCALACESCKIFFYRYQARTFSCIKANQCEIDIATRKSCQKCRMDKCLAAGMRITSTKAKSSSSEIQPNSSLRMILQTNLSEKSEESKRNIPKRRSSPFELNQFEREQIELIQGAISDAFKDENKMKIVGEVSQYVGLLNLHWPDFYARGIVRFCKNMIVFKQLNKDDQLVVLREFVIELLAVRLAFLLDIDKGGYLVIGNEKGDEAFFLSMKQSGPLKHPEEKKKTNKFFSCLHWEMENDTKIRDLLITIILFRPREKVVNQEFVSYQYWMHCRLLRKYLSHKYHSMYRAMRKYDTLMSHVDDLKVVKNVTKLVCQDSNVNQIPELFVEVLHLN